MMKVKPFSYHIPPRRKASPTSATTTLARIISSCSSSLSTRPRRTDLHSNSYSVIGDPRGNRDRNSNPVKTSYRRDISSTTPPPHSYLISLTSLCCGVGGITVLTLVLILVGFIGVAGQGKFTEMDGTSSSSRFPLQSHLSYYPSLSHRSFTSLTNLADGFDNESDEALQQRISSMGHYGVKYKNDSYNYSSQMTPYNYRSRQQYKVDPDVGALLTPSPRDSLLLSLHEDDLNDPATDDHEPISSKNNSVELDENKISQESKSIRAKLKRKQKLEEGGENSSEFVSVDKWRLPTQAKFNAYNNLNAKSPRDKDHLRKYEGGDNESKAKIISRANKNKGRGLFPPPDYDSGSEADDEDEEDDAHVPERFTPGNSSHTSGKLRFRQGSQAEVDGAELDDDSFPSTPTGSTSSSRRRPRRSVVHLYDMVVCSTGCNPLIFKGYGCYCGFLGSGLTVDGIDKCCAKHDYCYHHAKCPPLLTYFVPYYWRCDHGRPQCVTDFRGWKGVCGAHLCECDRQFAECLKKFPCPRSRAMCVTSPWRFWQNLLMTPAMRYRY